MASITPNTRKALTKALMESTSRKLEEEWEQICNRYQTGCVESDEIDLEKMEIVVDNGHLSNEAVERGGYWKVAGESGESVNGSGAVSSISQCVLVTVLTDRQTVR